MTTTRVLALMVCVAGAFELGIAHAQPIFDPPQLVVPAVGSGQKNPRLAAARDTWILVWWEYSGPGGQAQVRGARLERRRPGSWVPFTIDSKASGFPHVATDGQGNWGAVWLGQFALGSTWNVKLSRSNDDGVTWTTPQVIATAPPDGRLFLHPRIAASPGGTWLIVWVDPGQYTYPLAPGFVAPTLWMTRSTGGLTSWEPARPLGLGDANLSGGFSGTGHEVANGQAGQTWLVASLVNANFADFSSPDRRMRSAHSLDDAATWQKPREPSSDALSPPYGVAADGCGNAMLAARGQASIPGAYWSKDMGGSWGRYFDALRRHTTAVEQGAGDVATDRRGNWMVAWEGDVATTGGLFASHATDGSNWAEPVRLSCRASTLALCPGGGLVGKDPTVATDGSGSWMVVFRGWNAPYPGPEGLFASTTQIAFHRAEATCPANPRWWRRASTPPWLRWVWP